MLVRAFDEYRDSLGTCFQDAGKGGGTDELRERSRGIQFDSKYSFTH